MASVYVTLTQSVGADAANWYNGTYTDNTTWRRIGKHNTRDNYLGLLFDTTAMDGYHPDDLVGAYVEFYSNNSGTFETNIKVEPGPASAWASSGSDRPDNRYGALSGQSPTNWSVGTSISAGTYFDTPSITAQVKAALKSGTWDHANGDLIGIIMSGPTGSGSSEIQAKAPHGSNAAATWPRLVLEFDVSPQDASPTTTAPGASFSTDGADAIGLTIEGPTSYHDGVGSSAQRNMTIYTPQDSPPADGRPVMIFLHGGAWNSGGATSTPSRVINTFCRWGYTVIGATYKKTSFNLALNTNDGYNHPDPVQDLMSLISWMHTNAEDYELDVDNIIIGGNSAGGHLALELALALDDPDRDTYEMVYRGQSTTKLRYDAYPTLDITQGRDISDFSIKGVISWAGPIDLVEVHKADPTGILLRTAIAVFFGRKPQDSSSSSFFAGEGDPMSYITAATGSVYEDKTVIPPSFPILCIQDTTDIVVPPDAGLTALQGALSDTVYDQSSSNGVVNTNGGLTYHSYSGRGHDFVVTETDWDMVYDWLQTTGESSVDGGATTTAPQVQLSAGTASASVVQSRTVTTTAPTTSFMAPSATASKSQSRTVTTTAPTTAFTVTTAQVDTSQSRSVTLTAPTTAFTAPSVNTGSSTSKTVTTTADEAQFTVTSVTTSVSQSRGVSLTAPYTAFTTGTASAGSAASRNVNLTAVTASFLVASASASVVQDASSTTTAPHVTLTAGTASTGTVTNASITTTAPAASFVESIASGSVDQSRTVSPTAPYTAFTAGVASTMGGTPASVNLSAVAMALGIGTVSVTSSSPGNASVGAVSTTASPGIPTVTIQQDGTITVTAPDVAFGNGAASAGTAASRNVNLTALQTALIAPTPSVSAGTGLSVTTTAPDTTMTVGSALVSTVANALVNLEAATVVFQPSVAVAGMHVIEVLATELYPSSVFASFVLN